MCRVILQDPPKPRHQPRAATPEFSPAPPRRQVTYLDSHSFILFTGKLLDSLLASVVPPSCLNPFSTESHFHHDFLGHN
ncbi:hypothetical protein E2C01_055276 [Portunus trituberculatus]|uniref:Uncharacterized protein n=1 Tax=Portunus trituberculatus TaxID=210409 RepID=A0A5B7GM19_PORTR|nr:hypothetical protein [Portunus trituberculatus]